MDTKSLRSVLKAVSGGVRLDILRFLKTRRSASVSTIAKAVHRSVPTVSIHLSWLLAHNVVKRSQRSKEAYYRLSTVQKQPVKQILSLL